MEMNLEAWSGILRYMPCAWERNERFTSNFTFAVISVLVGPGYLSNLYMYATPLLIFLTYGVLRWLYIPPDVCKLILLCLATQDIFTIAAWLFNSCSLGFPHSALAVTGVRTKDMLPKIELLALT